jgi:hypothetical protein
MMTEREDRPFAGDKQGGAIEHGYAVTIKGVKSYLLSVVAIVAAAAPAALLAWWGGTALGLSGIPLALITAFVGMILSVIFLRV